ncbi:MAG: DeoR/GlpR family DNA-binding transcription regulator [Microbacteriaceae bacterium]
MIISARERRTMISQQLASLGEIDFATLAEEFEVSEMTIRRDIENLEEQGLLRKVMGGAISLVGKDNEPPFEARALLASVEKVHLAEFVVGMLEPNETVILDGGSTVLAVAKAIKGKSLGLTIVTPSLLAALELADEPDTSVLVTGGRVRPGEMTLIGPEAATSFLNYNCDTYIMGVAGIDESHGASEYHREEGSVKQHAVQSADRVIVVVDRSKLGQRKLVNVASLQQIDVIVTDADNDHPVLLAAKKLGVEVYCVPEPVSLNQSNDA